MRTFVNCISMTMVQNVLFGSGNTMTKLEQVTSGCLNYRMRIVDMLRCARVTATGE